MPSIIVLACKFLLRALPLYTRSQTEDEAYTSAFDKPQSEMDGDEEDEDGQELSYSDSMLDEESTVNDESKASGNFIQFTFEKIAMIREFVIICNLLTVSSPLFELLHYWCSVSEFCLALVKQTVIIGLISH